MVVAMDHSVTLGPGGRLADMADLVHEVVCAGPDGVIVHRGVASSGVLPEAMRPALVIHMSGNTTLSPDSHLKSPVCSVEAALQLGADCVSVHVPLGCGGEEDRRALRELADTADACARWSVPLVVMVYLSEPAAARREAFPHAVRAVADLGADVVKTAYPGDLRTLARIVEGCYVPVLVAGGEARGGLPDYLALADAIVDAGAAGVCVGRRVFESADPGAAVQAIKRVVYGRVPVADALEPRSVGNGFGALGVARRAARARTAEVSGV